MVLSVLTAPFQILRNGKVGGSVYRVHAEEPVPIYDSPVPDSLVLVRVKPGALIVAFDDPGSLRQVNTPDQSFGYIRRSVKLLPVESIDPEGLYDPETRAAAEAKLPPLEQMSAEYDARERRNRQAKIYFMVALVGVILLSALAVVLRSPTSPA
jgi:hypothetical protein